VEGKVELEKAHEEEILKAVRKAAQSVDYGEIRIKMDKTAPKLEIVIATQEKLRFEKNA
jgi:hypothetical protein